jgi:hypothetical protein
LPDCVLRLCEKHAPVLQGRIPSRVQAHGNSGDAFGDVFIEAEIFRLSFYADRFQGVGSDDIVNGVKQVDTVSDFTQGEDKIDLSAIDANGTLAGDQAFTFISDPASHPGDWTGLVWSVTDSRGTTTIFVSTDADADAEMQIYPPHAVQFNAGDFIL